MQRQVLFKILILMCIGMWGCLIPEMQARSNGPFTRIPVLKRPIWVKNQDIKSVHLAETVYIKKLEIFAEGVRNNASFEVMVNGENRGTVFAPGTDPTYNVTIKEAASSIQFRGTLGTSKITQIYAYVSKTEETVVKRYESNSWSAIASDIIDVATELEKHATYEQRRDFLFPIKEAATDLYAVAEGGGGISKIVKRVEELIEQMEMADKKCSLNHLSQQNTQGDPEKKSKKEKKKKCNKKSAENQFSFIDEMLQKEAADGLAQELLTLKEQLKSLL